MIIHDKESRITITKERGQFVARSEGGFIGYGNSPRAALTEWRQARAEFIATWVEGDARLFANKLERR